MPNDRENSDAGPPLEPVDTRNVVFHGYRRNLPHWRLENAVYFVTWRLHRGQRDLSPEERTVVADVLRHFDGKRFHMLAWVVMNDHVHVLVQLFEGYDLEKVVHSWKSYAARQLQRQCGRRGGVWLREYFDRVVRDGEEFEKKLCYIMNNPLKRWPDLDEYEWVGRHPRLE